MAGTGKGKHQPCFVVATRLDPTNILEACRTSAQQEENNQQEENYQPTDAWVPLSVALVSRNGHGDGLGLSGKGGLPARRDLVTLLSRSHPSDLGETRTFEIAPLVWLSVRPGLQSPPLPKGQQLFPSSSDPDGQVRLE